MTKKYNFGSTWLTVNYKCNNRCKWCYAKNPIETTNFDMPLDLAKSAIDLIKSLNSAGITLIGGEPTIYPHLDDVLGYGKSKNVKMGMVTNGRRLEDKIFLDNLFERGLTGVTISINGSSPEVHDGITGITGSFYQTKQAIKNCTEGGYKFTTETTICQENKDDLENILDMLFEIGVERPQFNICTRAITEDNPSTLTVYEDAKLREQLYLHAKAQEKKVKFIIPLPFCAYSPEIRKELLSTKTIYNSCQIYGGNGFVIDHNGDVLPCVRWSGYPLGNIKKQDNNIMNKTEFLEFWHNGDPKKFREKLRVYPSKECITDSDYWGDCHGGCPMLWLKYDAREEIKGINSDVTQSKGL